jgi:hypothetical protein
MEEAEQSVASHVEMNHQDNANLRTFTATL